MAATAPFEAGSISIRLYPHNELDAVGVVDEICRQAHLALDAEFDGVMTSEHHGGFGGYLPNPLQMTTFILEDNAEGWAAPCPLLLPLRPVAQVAEEIAWLAARHPGRVGLGVAAGALPLDFSAMEVPLAEAVPRFKRQLPRIVAMLRGDDLGDLKGDLALARCAEHPVPVLSAAVSGAAARRAARCGAGVLYEGMSPPGDLARLSAAYDGAGGTGCKMLIRRVWLGERRSEEIARQREIYASYGRSGGDPASLPADQTVAADGDQLVDSLAEVVRRVGADALNLRLHLVGLPAEAIREQISALGETVLPQLRRALSW
jgi:alkanesulfonate monooxygenase SsuD/methylene tetrahydromethanopterin reductase-like flavin-dependent oxidoreductase (luciferase family)